MRKLMMSAAIVVMSLPLAFATDPQKYALLVAVTKYDHAEMNKPQLEFPEADARSLGELLRSAGYQTDFLLGSAATQEAIRQRLANLNRKGSADGVAVIGMFGHGVEIETPDDKGKVSTEGCFCPFDTTVRVVKDFQGRTVLDDKGKPLTEPDPSTLVKLTELLTVLQAAKAGNRVVFADCCRIVPNKARGRTFGSSFKATDLPENTAVFFGCSPNEQAFEHEDWGHGAFTKCLLEELTDLSATGDVTTGVLADRLKKKVPKLVASISAKNRQTPKPFSTDSIDLRIASLTQKPATPSTTPPSTHPKETNTTTMTGKPTELTWPFSAAQAKAAQEALAKSLGKNVIEKNSLGMEMVLIPPGKFKMGSPPDEKGRQKDEDQVEVTLTLPFWLGKTEVTQGQWQKVMGTTPWKGKDHVREGLEYAATYVNWVDAQEFLKKLSQRDGVKYRLPTEAEWEWSCRAGTSSRFSFGDNDSDLDAYGWYGAFGALGQLADGNAQGEKYAHAVGGLLANPFGLFDMHGNVWEMCEDVYISKLPGGTNPKVSTGDDEHVIRGSAWSYGRQNIRSAVRSRITPDERGSYAGFRILRTQ